MLMDVKIPTIVGILTFTFVLAGESFKERNVFTFRYFSFYEQLNCWHLNIKYRIHILTGFKNATLTSAISYKRKLNVNCLCFDDVIMKWFLQSNLSFNCTTKLDDDFLLSKVLVTETFL